MRLEIPWRGVHVDLVLHHLSKLEGTRTTAHSKNPVLTDIIVQRGLALCAFAFLVKYELVVERWLFAVSSILPLHLVFWIRL